MADRLVINNLAIKPAINKQDMEQVTVLLAMELLAMEPAMELAMELLVMGLDMEQRDMEQLAMVQVVMGLDMEPLATTLAMAMVAMATDTEEILVDNSTAQVAILHTMLQGLLIPHHALLASALVLTQAPA